MARVGGQLRAGLDALERELPERGWIGGDTLGIADITVACAWGFTQSTIGDLLQVFDFRDYPRIADFAARAEELKAFRAAPGLDGVTAPIG